MPASKPKILLLGGITEAYELAEKLAHMPFYVTTSLAGRTENPRLPVGEYRIGGFGGVFGLIDYIKKNNIDLIIDATHPFATTMTRHAYEATRKTGIPLLRLERQKWRQTAKDNWILAETLEEAAKLIPEHGCAFLALGRQHLVSFMSCGNVRFIARMIELPDDDIIQKNFSIILAKPGNVEEETAFLKTHAIDVIVARNSGGERSYTKMVAARNLGLPVILIDRAPLPDIPIVSTVEEAVLKTQKLLCPLE